MQVSYELLTNVVFQHQYFNKQRLECLYVKPSVECERTLINYGLIYKNARDGFAIFYQTESNREVQSREALNGNNILLRFNIMLNDANFYNYTDSGIESLHNSHYYFHNIPEKREDTSKLKYLHHKEYVSKADVITQYTAHGDSLSKPFAVVDILIHNELHSEQVISFLQRKSHWRYILMGDHFLELHKPGVIGDGAIFNGPFTRLLANQKEVICFESQEPISHYQISKHHFQLVENDEGNDSGYRVVVRRLPTPDVTTISTIKEKTEKEKIEFSEIFIY